MDTLLIAFILDLVFGDPVYHWHPVRILGRWIEGTEKWLRGHLPNLQLAGLVLAIYIPLVTLAAIWFLIAVADQFDPLLKKILSIYFLYSAISIKDLAGEARRIYMALRNQKLEKARENLSRIVGRDTKDLSETEVIRGTVEAVAESFVDGVLAPLFYGAIGGPVLAMTYKAINTLDSTVGKKTPRYRDIGHFPAKLDEIVNWIPARISWFLIGIGAFFLNGRGKEAWRVGVEDGAATSFSNSVVPEAAFAGALGVELGGTNYYAEKAVETPKLGYPMRALEQKDIRLASRLMRNSAWATLIFALLLNQIFYLIFH